jgi:hypothetical protein
MCTLRVCAISALHTGIDAPPSCVCMYVCMYVYVACVCLCAISALHTGIDAPPSCMYVCTYACMGTLRVCKRVHMDMYTHLCVARARVHHKDEH